MQKYRSILSLALLGVYTLLLLHDFIPHAHLQTTDSSELESTSALAHHHHGHTHHHHHHQTAPADHAEANTALTAEGLSVHRHQLPENTIHFHELVHRASSKIKLPPSFCFIPCQQTPLLPIKKVIYHSGSFFFDFHSAKAPALSYHSLRAPPIQIHV
ncbi:MAG: hypothetical protein GYB31_00530 [Bacteroidetes bacterium]|nr:hypothetical protein [Bacteroidota bacterium]